MSLLRIVFAAAVLAAVLSLPHQAEAGPRVSFGYYGPGVSIYVGPRPYYPPYYYRPYYGPYYYQPYYAPRRYYVPRRSYSSRCAKWRSRCARRWGYGGRNYRGCLRYHRCR